MIFSKVIQTSKAFCLFDATFSSILKKYRSFATAYYSLVATSAMFAELKLFKAICQGNRHTLTHTERLQYTRYVPTQNVSTVCFC